MRFAKLCFRLYLCANFEFVGAALANGACMPDGPPTTPEMVKGFLEKPDFILGNEANNKRLARVLSVSISQYAAADPSAISAITSILPSATFQQRWAIGEGLFAAVEFCRARDPAVAKRIANAIVSIGDKDVVSAYRLTETLSDPSIDGPDRVIATETESGAAWKAGNALIGTPTSKDPGSLSLSLQLSDPFASPDTWR